MARPSTRPPPRGDRSTALLSLSLSLPDASLSRLAILSLAALLKHGPQDRRPLARRLALAARPVAPRRAQAQLRHRRVPPQLGHVRDPGRRPRGRLQAQEVPHARHRGRRQGLHDADDTRRVGRHLRHARRPVRLALDPLGLGDVRAPRREQVPLLVALGRGHGHVSPRVLPGARSQSFQVRLHHGMDGEVRVRRHHQRLHPAQPQEDVLLHGGGARRQRVLCRRPVHGVRHPPLGPVRAPSRRPGQPDRLAGRVPPPRRVAQARDGSRGARQGRAEGQQEPARGLLCVSARRKDVAPS